MTPHPTPEPPQGYGNFIRRFHELLNAAMLDRHDAQQRGEDWQGFEQFIKGMEHVGHQFGWMDVDDPEVLAALQSPTFPPPLQPEKGKGGPQEAFVPVTGYPSISLGKCSVDIATGEVTPIDSPQTGSGSGSGTPRTAEAMLRAQRCMNHAGAMMILGALADTLERELKEARAMLVQSQVDLLAERNAGELANRTLAAAKQALEGAERDLGLAADEIRARNTALSSARAELEAAQKEIAGLKDQIEWMNNRHEL